jgi:hypothetical protein
VIDAAGAIYVIGGDGRSSSGSIFYNDVLVSNDGGEDRTRSGTRGLEVTYGVLKGVLREL